MRHADLLNFTSCWRSAAFFAIKLVISVLLGRRGPLEQDPDAARIVHM